MKMVQTSLLLMVLNIMAIAPAGCQQPGSTIQLTGSTPGDASILLSLHIPQTATVDFIRWNLQLATGETFQLEIVYGESQPNTLGFKHGGSKKAFTGRLEILQHSPYQKVYQLISNELNGNIRLAQLDNNTFHVLDDQYELMAGNGGWSYSLTNAKASEPGEIMLSGKAKAPVGTRLTYEGRTPCQDMARLHKEMQVSDECFKIKWKLVLNRDAETNQPTTCSIRNIADNEPRDITGTWTETKVGDATHEMLLYKISVPNLRDPLVLWVASDKVLYFVDQQNLLLNGNGDFSFVMNRNMN